MNPLLNAHIRPILTQVSHLSPGLKFSQVEFVAVLALLMREYRLGIVKEKGETEEQARERVKGVINDCDMQLLLRMRDSDRVRLRCEPVP